MTDTDPRPIVAVTPANGYVVHAAHQPHDDALVSDRTHVYRGITLCGVRGLDHTHWGGIRPYTRPGQVVGAWHPFHPDIAPDARTVTHPICRSCVRRWKRIVGQRPAPRGTPPTPLG